jgi:hypothetical protein
MTGSGDLRERKWSVSKGKSAGRPAISALSCLKNSVEMDYRSLYIFSGRPGGMTSP